MSKRAKAARRSPAEWASLIEACERSGLSRTAFAEREGIHPRTFTWWASRLATGTTKATRATNDSKAAEAASFVPVRISASPYASSSPRTAARAEHSTVTRGSLSGRVEVVLMNGRSVRCELEQVDDPRLSVLLSLAEGELAC
jgi:hypothetical protein